MVMGYNRRELMLEDTHCWWCGSPIKNHLGEPIDIQMAMFCNQDCHNRWIKHLHAMDDKFQEWDD